MISNISGSGMPDGHGHGTSAAQAAGSSHAPQPAIRSPEVQVTINNKEDKPVTSEHAKHGETKKSDIGESLGELLKKGMAALGSLLEGAGKILSGLASVAAPLLKMIGIGK